MKTISEETIIHRSLSYPNDEEYQRHKENMESNGWTVKEHYAKYDPNDDIEIFATYERVFCLNLNESIDDDYYD